MLPNFIPDEPPTNGLFDLSGKISPGDLQIIRGSIQHVYDYHPKVLVLPADKTPPNFKAFVMELKDQWKITGDRLLLVVDTKGHQVRAISGNDLNAKGITGDYLNRDVVQAVFLPNAKRGDYGQAIHQSLMKVNQKLTKSQAAIQPPAFEVTNSPYKVVYPASTTIINQAPSAPTKVDFNPVMGGLLFVLIAGAVIFAIISGLYNNNDLEKNKKQFKSLNDELNRKINTLSEAKDFVPKSHEALYNLLMKDFFDYTTKIRTARSSKDYEILIESAKLITSNADVLANIMFEDTKEEINKAIKQADEGKTVTSQEVKKNLENRKPKPSQDFKRSKEYSSSPSIIQNNTYIDYSSSSWSPAPPPVYSPPPAKEETSSDSGTSSWSDDSSSSSSSDWGDSGTSSWDSGSSSSDSSSGGDSGTSSW